MIIKTKEGASLLIGAVAGICTAVAMVVVGSVWWLVLVASLLVFVAVSLFALLMIVKYVAYKLRPIYSMVLSRDIHTGDIATELKDKKVDDVSTELSSWAEDNDREIARLKEAEKFRKQYLGNVAHELKTPIFNIQGYISTLLDGGLEDEVINRKYLERAERSVERMINILSDLDTISRLDSDMNQMRTESFDMVALCKEIADQVEIEASKRNISIIV